MSKPDLHTPYLTADLPGIGGRIRARPEDFIVEEVPILHPSGNGNHLYINMTKMGVTTREVQEQLARLFDVRYQDVGTAGLKDKESVATQTFSVELKEKMDKEYAAALVEEDVGFRVNWMEYHDTKYRSGHILGNKFTILITDMKLQRSQAFERAERITTRIQEQGVPNYYGEQRMGRRGKNVVAGWQILNGEKRVSNTWLRRYLIAAYQGYLCNMYLATRLEDGLFTKLIDGDIVSGHDQKNRYWVADLDVDTPKFKEKQVSFTAPMYGTKMMEAEGKAHVLEDSIFKASGLKKSQLKQQKVTGARRLGKMVPEVTVEIAKRGIQLSFTLEKGGFATTILREYMKKS